jgi:hypothetical protein
LCVNEQSGLVCAACHLSGLSAHKGTNQCFSMPLAECIFRPVHFAQQGFELQFGILRALGITQNVNMDLRRYLNLAGPYRYGIHSPVRIPKAADKNLDEFEVSVVNRCQSTKPVQRKAVQSRIGWCCDRNMLMKWRNRLALSGRRTTRLDF